VSGGEFNKELLERTLKQVKAEKDKPLEETTWWQQRWASGLKNTGRKVTAMFSDARSYWAPVNLPASREMEVEVMEVDCGTAFCVAGHAALFAGDTFVRPVGITFTRGETSFVMTHEGEIMGISERAQGLFGITDSEAQRLFDGSNSWHKVKRVARDICEKRGERLSLG